MAAARPVEVDPPGAHARPRPTRAQIQSVRDMLERDAHAVQALSRPVMARLRPILEQAQREVARDLRTWLSAVPSGDLRFTAQRYRSLLLSLRHSLKAIEALDPALADGLSRMSEQTGQLATDHMVSEVARMSAVFDGAAIHLPVNAVAILHESTSYLIPRFRTSAARYANGIADDIRRELAVGLVRGESVSALTDRLVRLSGPRGVVALHGVKGEPGALTEHIAEGLFRRYRFWAERIVRTEVTASYSYQAHQATWQAARTFPELKRRWDASIDGRTCAQCMSLDGQVVDLGQSFPGGISGPPVHPMCRCVATPWMERWSKFMN